MIKYNCHIVRYGKCSLIYLSLFCVGLSLWHGMQIANLYFFLLYQAKLWCDCPFWPDDGMCRLRDCSVCECPKNEFPEPFRKPFHKGLSSEDLICQEGKPEAAVDRTIDARVFRGWVDVDNPWTNDDETDNGFISLLSLFPFCSI